MRKLVVNVEFSISNMFPTQNLNKIEEILICGTNETYQNLEIDFIEFRRIDLLPIPDFKKIEECLIFRTDLGLKGQRY